MSEARWMVGDVFEQLATLEDGSVNSVITSPPYIDHLCGVRRCVNPEHLEAVTHRENLLRGTGFAAVNAAKTHCPHGHEYTPENTYHNPNPNGGRICRTCKRKRDAERRRRSLAEGAA